MPSRRPALYYAAVPVLTLHNNAMLCINYYSLALYAAMQLIRRADRGWKIEMARQAGFLEAFYRYRHTACMYMGGNSVCARLGKPAFAGGSRLGYDANAAGHG